MRPDVFLLGRAKTEIIAEYMEEFRVVRERNRLVSAGDMWWHRPAASLRIRTLSYDGDEHTTVKSKETKVVDWSLSEDVPIHHCLAAIGTARHLKLNRMELLSAIRVNPGIQRTCASCQMQRRWRE